MPKELNSMSKPKKLTKKELSEYWNTRETVHRNMASDLKPYTGIDKKRFLDIEKRRNI